MIPIENFIEYMWYLFTTPLKKLKKSQNRWYVFCRVFGTRFDKAKEDILRARDEGMVATCNQEMLQVHGADRRLTRYEGEHPENFRSRIAMYEKICKLGGTNEGVLLAVRTLGYNSVEIVRANELIGYKYYPLDGSWLIDGNRKLESDIAENSRWAEFYIIIAMDAGEGHPISFEIMQKTVRKWKEVGAKDNYLFQYNAKSTGANSVRIREVLYRKCLYYLEQTRYCTGHKYFFATNFSKQYKGMWREQHNLIFLDGTWNLDGSQIIDAWQEEGVLECQ